MLRNAFSSMVFELINPEKLYKIKSVKIPARMEEELRVPIPS